jgi:hypothetical protein
VGGHSYRRLRWRLKNFTLHSTFVRAELLILPTTRPSRRQERFATLRALPQRMRAAIECLPFVHPKLSLATNFNVGFASRMKANVERLGQRAVIDAKPNEAQGQRQVIEADRINGEPKVKP